ncbi:MAG: 2Fe-2S iron-sulfur cluster-binding protein [Burkholderiaceae bacterium]|nr:2Fe-2S iron-sulfur cluster-binding protein [Burkholderiaceae bacterium]
MATAHFHPLLVRRIVPDAAGSVVVTLQVPPALAGRFDFRPGQFLTLRADIGGQSVRRSYSICSAHARYARTCEIDIGIKPVPGGLFSNWAVTQLRAGDTIEVMPPEGRFTPSACTQPRHRVGFAAGSGITPLLSIMRSTLEDEAQSRFTLVYGNRNMFSIMFNEALQDLKDRHPSRVTLIQILSRQLQEVPLLNGRIDRDKVAQLMATVLPPKDIDEAFICGPEGMIEAVQASLLGAGLAQGNIHSERFFAADAAHAATGPGMPREPQYVAAASSQDPLAHESAANIELEVVLDGKTHALRMRADEHVLDAALAAGLDLPYSCRGGVCCTCRARVTEGRVAMDRNFTLEPAEIDQGYALTCQSRPLTQRLVVNYDAR